MDIWVPPSASHSQTQLAVTAPVAGRSSPVLSAVVAVFAQTNELEARILSYLPPSDAFPLERLVYGELNDFPGVPLGNYPSAEEAGSASVQVPDQKV